MDMMHVGLDLSRLRVDVCVLDDSGTQREELRATPDREGLARLAAGLQRPGVAVRAVIESMNGARFVHDQLELAGWDVSIADAQRVKGLAPLTCKTDRIDAWVLAELRAVISYRRSGCPHRGCAPNENGPAGGSIWSDIAPD